MYTPGLGELFRAYLLSIQAGVWESGGKGSLGFGDGGVEGWRG